jgi:hypothetical protein
VALDYKYEKAIDLKLADPNLEWATIATQIDVSERQLRRVRASKEWQDYWNEQDKQSAIDIVRKQAQGEANAALWKLYFELTGIIDPTAQEALLRMTDEEFLKQVAYIVEWNGKQAAGSKGTDGASP